MEKSCRQNKNNTENKLTAERNIGMPQGVFARGKSMSVCNICPRKCNIERTVSRGFCGEGNAVRVARAALHFWEEPCISGKNGSGTVFFSGCNLRCVYCQNKPISRGNVGREISTERLCEIFFELREKGAHNINLVTPTHFSAQIKEAVAAARSKGFDLPVVWNTGGYENADVIESLADTVDIYLTDFKYFSSDLALKFSAAADYPSAAKAALDAMVRTKGAPVFDDGGMMKRGVIVRHLVLPGHTDDSVNVLKYIYSRFGDAVMLSIMRQYTPMEKNEKYPELSRTLTSYEYEKVTSAATEIGVKLAYGQDKGTAKESFIPDFDCTGV